VRRLHQSRGDWAVPVLVAIVTVIAFLPALRADFVTWDDNRNFLDHTAWRGLGPAQLRWMWTTFHMGHYVPLAWMTLGLDYVLGGMNPMGYHLHNVILHAVNAMLVYAIALRVLRLARPIGDAGAVSLAWPAAFAALLFSVHPLRVESVAWITERRDVLSMLLCLVSVLWYLRHVEHGGTGRWYWLSIVAFAAALLSKATSMSLPAVLVLLNVYPLRRIGGQAGFVTNDARRVCAELLPFATLAAATAALSIVALDPPGQLPLGAKLAVSAYSLTFYVVKSLVPTNLAPLYEMPKAIDPASARYVASTLVALGLTIGAWVIRRRWPGVTAAWFVFLVIVLPMLGIVQNGPQIAADRYTYHASPALAILAGAALTRWTMPPAMRAIVIGAPVILLGVLTWRQTLIWQDSERLWTRVLEVDRNSSVAEIALGDLMIAEDRVDEAVHHYGRGVELDPAFAGGFNNLGVALARQGRLDAAVERYKQAIALNPGFGDAHNNWGIALSQQGDVAVAIEHFQQAIALDSTNADAEVNLGNAIVRRGRPAEAIAHYARAAALRPDHPETYLNWGVSLAQTGDFVAAVEQFRRVLALRPGHVEATAYLDRAERLRTSAAPR
jgi:protein O-mannosyl-transferase